MRVAPSVVILIGSSGLLGMAAPIHNRRDALNQPEPSRWNSNPGPVPDIFINGKRVLPTKPTWLNEPDLNVKGGASTKPNSPATENLNTPLKRFASISTNSNSPTAKFGVVTKPNTNVPFKEFDSASTNSNGASSNLSPPSSNMNSNSIPKNKFLVSERPLPGAPSIKKPNTVSLAGSDPKSVASAQRNPTIANPKGSVAGANPLSANIDIIEKNNLSPSAMEQWRQRPPVIKKTDSFMIDENGSRISSNRGSSQGVQESKVVWRGGGSQVAEGFRSAGSTTQRGAVVGADHSSLAGSKSRGTLPIDSKLSAETMGGSSASFRSSGLGSQPGSFRSSGDGAQLASQNTIKTVVSQQIPSTRRIGTNPAILASGTDDAALAKMMANRSKDPNRPFIKPTTSITMKVSDATVAAGKLAPRDTEEVDSSETETDRLAPEQSVSEESVSDESVSLEQPAMKELDSAEPFPAMSISQEQAPEEPASEAVGSEEPISQESGSDELTAQEASPEESTQEVGSEEIGTTEEGATNEPAPAEEPKKEGRLKALYRKTKDGVKSFFQNSTVQGVVTMVAGSVASQLANGVVFGALGIH